MELSFRWTDGKDKDFQGFYLKTEEFYSSIVGGRKNREGFIPYNISESISDVLIAEVDGKAVGCGGLKMYSPSTVEIKRLWVDPDYRGAHIATEIIERLEEVFLLDIVALLDIGDRPRDAQNLIVRAGGQSEIVHRLF